MAAFGLDNGSPLACRRLTGSAAFFPHLVHGWVSPAELPHQPRLEALMLLAPTGLRTFALGDPHHRLLIVATI
jgi:hypothetical protein